VTDASCDAYHDWRVAHVQYGTGNRAADRELNTLSNAFRYVKVHDGLAALLDAHRKWKEDRYPNSPWYFPSPRKAQGPVWKGALTHALGRLHRNGKIRKLTSHGGRAYYVTVRWSHGIPDSQIAFEIGHTSAGVTLAAVYGGVPPHWVTGEGPKMEWLPSGKPAWELITPPKCLDSRFEGTRTLNRNQVSRRLHPVFFLTVMVSRLSFLKSAAAATVSAARFDRF